MSFFDRFRQKPGLCECGHKRCFHAYGNVDCNFIWRDEEGKFLQCPCQTFIRVDDEDEEAKNELQRMYDLGAR